MDQDKLMGASMTDILTSVKKAKELFKEPLDSPAQYDRIVDTGDDCVYLINTKELIGVYDLEPCPICEGSATYKYCKDCHYELTRRKSSLKDHDLSKISIMDNFEEWWAAAEEKYVENNDVWWLKIRRRVYKRHNLPRWAFRVRSDFAPIVNNRQGLIKNYA